MQLNVHLALPSNRLKGHSNPSQQQLSVVPAFGHGIFLAPCTRTRRPSIVINTPWRNNWGQASAKRRIQHPQFTTPTQQFRAQFAIKANLERKLRHEGYSWLSTCQQGGNQSAVACQHGRDQTAPWERSEEHDKRWRQPLNSGYDAQGKRLSPSLSSLASKEDRKRE